MGSCMHSGAAGQVCPLAAACPGTLKDKTLNPEMNFTSEASQPLFLRVGPGSELSAAVSDVEPFDGTLQKHEVKTGKGQAEHSQFYNKFKNTPFIWSD